MATTDLTTTTLTPFQFQEHTLSVITDDQGEPWWIAAEVCAILEVKNVSDALGRLDADEKNTIVLSDGLPGNPTTLILNESGLYSLILSSRKKSAKDFKRWVTREVLPSIRKTGQYHMAPAIDRFPELRAIVELVQSTAEARLVADEAKVEAQHAKALAQAAIETQHFLTIREYVFINHLERQLAPSLQSSYGRWLAGYCLEHGVPVRRVQIADRQYDAENAYHVGTMESTLRGWLTRRNGQQSLRVVDDI